MKTFTSGFAAEVAKKRGARPVWILRLNTGYYAGDRSANIAASANGGTAAASSSQSGYPASNAIDGDTATYWRDSTSNTYPDWLEVAFASTSIIDTVVVKFGQPVQDFTIDYWDGSAWVTVVSRTSNSLATITAMFAAVTTSKIRFYVTKGDKLTYGSNLREIEAYGIINYNAGTNFFISDSSISVPGWNGGITTKAWVSSWGEIREQVSGSINEIRMADFSVSLIDDPDETTPATAMATTYDLESSPVSLYLWYLGLNAANDPPVEFFRGYVRDVSIPEEHVLRLDITDEADRLTATYGEILSQENWPSCLANDVGKLFPVVFGTADSVLPLVASVDATFYWYVFGCPLDSVSNVRRIDAGGTTTSLASTSGTPSTNQYRLYTGATGSQASGFGARAVVQTLKQSSTAQTGTQQMSVAPAYFAFGVSGQGYVYPGDSTYGRIVDGDDTTWMTVTTGASYICGWGFTQPKTTATKVRGRARMRCDASLTITLQLKNPSGTVVATASATGPFNGWLDTGWITDSVPSGSTWMVQIVYSSYNVFAYYYGAWIDVEYTYTSGYTYTDLSTQLLMTAARAVNDNTPDDAATIILGQSVAGTWEALPASYKVNGAVTEPKRTIDLLDYLAFQNRCWFRIRNGTAKLIWRPDTLNSQRTISAVRVDGGKRVWSRRRAPKTDIINSVTLRYNRTANKTGDDAYQSIASGSDSTSIAAFGRLSRDELFRADFVTNDQHAQSVRDFYLAALKNRYWLEEIEVYLDQIDLEFGDVVTLPDGRMGVVVSVGIQPGSVDQMDKIKLTVTV